MNDLLRELLVVLGMAAAMILVHLLGLMGLVRLTRFHIKQLRTPWLALDRVLVPLSMVLVLFLLHALEVGAYAGLYRGVDAARTWEQALDLSVGAYSTVGWPGVPVADGWRLVAGFESLQGALLVGWSTAFLFQNLHRILQDDQDHPLPKGAIAESGDEPPDEAAEAGKDSPRPNRSGSGAP